MKKLTALLMGCMMIVCAAVSCGKSDDSDSEGSKKGSGASQSDDEKQADPIVGTWAGENPEEDGFVTFDENGGISMKGDLSMLIQFDGDKVMFGGEDVTQFAEFDGENFTLNAEGQELLTLKKTEKGSADNYDGTYEITGGMFVDMMASQFGAEGSGMSFKVDGKTTYMIIEGMGTYTANGDNKYTVTAMGETNEAVIDGDKLTMFDENGEEDAVFTREK